MLEHQNNPHLAAMPDEDITRAELLTEWQNREPADNSDNEKAFKLRKFLTYEYYPVGNGFSSVMDPEAHKDRLRYFINLITEELEVSDLVALNSIARTFVKSPKNQKFVDWQKERWPYLFEDADNG